MYVNLSVHDLSSVAQWRPSEEPRPLQLESVLQRAQHLIQNRNFSGQPPTPVGLPNSAIKGESNKRQTYRLIDLTDFNNLFGQNLARTINVHRESARTDEDLKMLA